MVASRYPFLRKPHAASAGRRAGPVSATRRHAGAAASATVAHPGPVRDHVSPASPVTSIDPPRRPDQQPPAVPGAPPARRASAAAPRRRPSDRSPTSRSRASAEQRLAVAAAVGGVRAAADRGVPQVGIGGIGRGRPRVVAVEPGVEPAPAVAAIGRDRDPLAGDLVARARARAGASAAGGRRCAPAGCGRSRCAPPSTDRITPPSSIPTASESGSVGCSAIVLTWWVHGRGGKDQRGSLGKAPQLGQQLPGLPPSSER